MLRLLEELEADDIPMLTAYNKRDQKLPDFIPSAGRDHIMVSAKFEEDANAFKEAIQRYLREELLTSFEAHVPASEGSSFPESNRKRWLIASILMKKMNGTTYQAMYKKSKASSVN